MLHPAKGAGEVPDYFIRHQPIHRRDSRHIIFQVVQTGQKDVIRGQYGPSAAHHCLFPQVDPALHRFLSAEQGYRSTGLFDESGGNLVVRIEYQPVTGVLMGKNIPLRRHILVHISVYIHVVWGQIGHHRNAGALPDGHQLERGQLQHHHVVRADVVYLAQEGVADISTHEGAVTRRLEQAGDNGRSGGFSIGAGHRNDPAWAQIQERLHFRGELRPRRHRPGDLRRIGPQAGGAEDHVRPLQMIQVFRAENG